jgi:RNA 2',3'-cyclic 3'-phosphodiesterase
MRLFLGIPIPTRTAEAFVHLARQVAPAGRPTPPHNLHLTLVFLGEVREPIIPILQQHLSQLHFSPFQITPTNLDIFQRGAILVVGIHPAPALLQLQASVAQIVQYCGLPVEDREYHPHLTLARSRTPIRLPHDQRNLPRKLPRALTHPIPVSEVNLYRSTLTPTGSVYEILFRKELT